ncbi:MAG: OmpH family outer membrane protein [Verrucomicrobia bacterium]|nr:OmpH family outer membrane protein [Verrucomicrobiota bacterium]MBU6446131.1 OmpH family outer membrane protein [Verrucomicrobiota bacterium]MDE3047307.1 OmpH family outer membrane protein [Verrucomicrobiota bacterium]
MRKFFLSAATILSLSCGSVIAAETPVIGVVNFATCITDSKTGKKEQENLEAMRKLMTAQIEDTDKELKEMGARFEDPEYLDSLSPKAEEELKGRFQARQEDLVRYQNQFYQMMNHAQMQMLHKMSGSIAKAAEKIALEKHLDYVMNKEACFYIRPDLDVTAQVITELDKKFEAEEKTKKVTDNSEIHAIEETMIDQAG